MYKKSENLEKIQQLTDELFPPENVHSQILETLLKVKSLLDQKSVDKNLINAHLDCIIDKLKK